MRRFSVLSFLWLSLCGCTILSMNNAPPDSLPVRLSLSPPPEIRVGPACRAWNRSGAPGDRVRADGDTPILEVEDYRFEPLLLPWMRATEDFTLITSEKKGIARLPGSAGTRWPIVGCKGDVVFLEIGEFLVPVEPSGEARSPVYRKTETDHYLPIYGAIGPETVRFRGVRSSRVTGAARDYALYYGGKTESRIHFFKVAFDPETGRQLAKSTTTLPVSREVVVWGHRLEIERLTNDTIECVVRK